MKWMRERDLLIAQTMAFVQSVTGKRPDPDKPAATSSARSDAFKSFEPVAAPIPNIEAVLADTSVIAGLPKTELPKLAPMARTDLRVDFQSEIRTRVANFRAHQERFRREREAYCSATMAKVDAALRKHGERPRLGK
jgi:hypothetical protein